MNPYVIRENLLKKVGAKVVVKIFGMRNKNDIFYGTIKDIYPQIFTVDTLDGIKSISYSDIISGDVVIGYI